MTHNIMMILGVLVRVFLKGLYHVYAHYTSGQCRTMLVHLANYTLATKSQSPAPGRHSRVLYLANHGLGLKLGLGLGLVLM